MIYPGRYSSIYLAILVGGGVGGRRPHGRARVGAFDGVQTRQAGTRSARYNAS
eukprot:SAG31_NODE_469_length_15244_cov_11.537141_13_plen_53_part_00